MLSLSVVAVASEPSAHSGANDDAALFGALETAYSAQLSADGQKLVYVGPGDGVSTVAVVIDLVKSQIREIARADGKPFRLSSCGWTAADRLTCQTFGVTQVAALPVSVSRMLAMNADGSKQLPLGQRNSVDQLGLRYGDGYVVDWMNGVDGMVLMARSNVPEKTVGRLTARTGEGLSVELIDTTTGKSSTVEPARRDAIDYLSDGQGHIRIMTVTDRDFSRNLRGLNTHMYRKPGDQQWLELGSSDFQEEGMVPLAVDSNVNAAYVLQRLDGRKALFRVALDGTLKAELVYANKDVDVDGVVVIGRSGRVIGATYVTDRRHAEYFDPVYREIAQSLSRALPNLPLIELVSASADEQTLLVWAGSDINPGRLYVFDRQKRNLRELFASRPRLKDVQLSAVRPVSYSAADGTQIPGYLTLPPGRSDARNLPAIVMPHGGPAARGGWGFDWLAQYFAHRGFAVLQPNFRGSSGYGDQWFVKNGFRSWRTSVGDICDGGRWLVKQGIADPARLAIFGWSYGGYAALQANVLDPDLFKAVVAVAPVTDLAQMKNEALSYTSSHLVADFIGSGPHIQEGSPAQNARSFKAPVLMFHGDLDLNVDIEQSRRMDRELHQAGKSSELVVYPGLSHTLADSDARADLLRRSDAFLRQQLRLSTTSEGTN